MSTKKTQAFNTKVISQQSDLPFNASTGEHELEGGTVYKFDGFVTSPYPLNLATTANGNSPLRGHHGSVDGFIHTGTGTAIKGSGAGLFMKDMYCHAPGGTIFDVSGDLDDEVLIESVSFSDAAGLGNIADLGVIDGMRIPSVRGSNFENFDSGLTFSGESSASISNVPDKIFISGCPVRDITASGVTCFTFTSNVGPEVIDINECYVKGVQPDTEVIRVETGATPTQVFQYRGNTHDGTVDVNNILNGEAAVTSVGYNVSDSEPLRDSTTIGEFNLTTDVTTTINTAGTYEKVQGDGNIGNETERMQETATNGQLEYLGRTNTNALVSVSASITGANGDTYAVAVAKNGTIEPTSVVEVEGSGQNAPKAVSTTSIEDLKQNDTVSLYATNLDATNDITFRSYGFNVVGV